MTAEPAPIRPAATVMLLRDAPHGPEVFTLQRVPAMVFAPGMTVFPGGGVDESDTDPAVPWCGPDAAWWAERWGIDEASARAGVVCAVRELYEETGVLIAAAEPPEEFPGASPEVVGLSTRPSASVDPRPPERAAARALLAGHGLGLAALLRSGELRLDASALRPWGRWITPPGLPRRYDTFFFAARLPAGQDPDFATTEAAAGGWHRPGDLLARGRAGTIGLMPPTVAMLTDLAAAADVTELLAGRRVLTAVTNDRPAWLARGRRPADPAAGAGGLTTGQRGAAHA